MIKISFTSTILCCNLQLWLFMSLKSHVLFYVIEFICLVSVIRFMLISNHHFKIRYFFPYDYKLVFTLDCKKSKANDVCFFLSSTGESCKNEESHHTQEPAEIIIIKTITAQHAAVAFLDVTIFQLLGLFQWWVCYVSPILSFFPP